MKSAHDLPSKSKRPSIKLTTKVVREFSLPPDRDDDTLFDTDVKGFGVRLRKGGSRKFVFVYKLSSKQRRMGLGATSARSVDDARKAAGKLHARVIDGQDPASEKADAKLKAAETFKATAEAYLEDRRPRLRPATFPNLERHLLGSVAGGMCHAKSLHQMQLAKIARRDIATVIAAVAKGSGQPSANRVRASLSSFFAWAMEQGLVDTNPVIGTTRHKEQSRERVLAPDELRAIWAALGEDRYGDIVKLLMLTGQRLNEIAGLRWPEIRDDMIVLPGERTKNHRGHLVPLSAAARKIIAEQPRHQGRDLIFGRYAESGTFSAWSSSKAQLDDRMDAARGDSLPGWVHHDLRRSVATGMADLGVQPHVIEAALNHVSGHKSGVAGIYNRSTYEREKRQALDLWAEHLTAIVEGRESNVMPLRRA